MKTSGQSASTNPARRCSTCDAKLAKHEYDLCDACRSHFDMDGPGRDSQPRYDEKPDDWQ